VLRDGFHQHVVHSGVAPYRPNSLDGGCPFHAGPDTGAFTDSPVVIPATTKQRGAPASYDDHFSRATLFWRSMSAVEQEHIVRAYTFELSKCYERELATGLVAQRTFLTARSVELDAVLLAGSPPPAPDALPARDATAAGSRSRLVVGDDGSSVLDEVLGLLAAHRAWERFPTTLA